MKGKILSFLIIFSLFVIYVGKAYSGAPDIKEGLWEITIKMEMQDMPMQMPPKTIKQCIKKDNPIPRLEESDKDCKFTSKQITGNTVLWKAECKDKEGITTVTGKISYKGTTFDGTEEIRDNGELIMKGKISGRWIGPCK